MYYLHHAIIELTSICNLHCHHCYNWWKQENKEKQLFNSYRKALRLLQFLIHHTSVGKIIFSGGEPTISERFTELVLHAKINQKQVTVITNGNGDSEVYQQLASFGVDLIEFSIHSLCPEIHDKITGVEGSWKKAIANLKKMIENGIQVIPIIVITRYNSPQIIATISYLHSLGIHSFMVNRYNIGGAGLNNSNPLSASAQELQAIFHSLDEYASGNQVRIVSGVCTPYCLLNPSDYPHIGFGVCSKDIYKRPLTFDLAGNLRLCNHSPHNAGNIYRQSLEQILTSAYVKSWLDTPIPHCQCCAYPELCRGGCRAASEQTGHPLSSPDPILQELQLRTPFTS